MSENDNIQIPGKPGHSIKLILEQGSWRYEYVPTKPAEPPLPCEEVEQGVLRLRDLVKERLDKVGLDYDALERCHMAVDYALNNPCNSILRSIAALKQEVARLTEECAWLRAIPIEGYDPDIWRTDAGNTWLKRKDYGDRGSKYGWVIGSDGKPVQWDKEQRSAD